MLYDEHALSGTAYQMHHERTFDVPSRAHFVSGRLVVLNTFVDKRRPMYPFLVSVLHDVTGYRPGNALLLNALLSVALLGLVYGWGSVLGGPRYGVLATLLITTLPLLAQSATGGGLDLLNLTLVLLLLHALRSYLLKPGSDGLNLAVVVAVMLASTRYESVLYTGALGLVVLYKWRQERRITLTWFSALSPLLLAATIFTHRVWPPNDSFFQAGEGVRMFGLEHLRPNAEILAYVLFSPPWEEQANSFFLSLLGGFALVAIALLLVLRLRKVLEWPLEVIVFAPVLAVGFAVTGLTQFYFWGQLNDPMATRFALTLCLMMALCVPMVGMWPLGRVRLPGWVLILPAAWLLLWTLPQNARHFMTGEIVASTESEWFYDWAAQNAGPRQLLVSESCIASVLYGHPGVAYGYLKERGRAGHLGNAIEAGLYDDIFVLERRFIDHRSGGILPAERHLAPAALVLEPVQEIHLRPHVISIISRVTGMRDAEGNVVPLERRRLPSFESDAKLVAWLLEAYP